MFAVIFAVIALALLFAPPRFRKIGGIVVGALFVLFLAVVLLNRQPLSVNVPSPPSPQNVSPESRRFDFDKYRQEKKDEDDPEAKKRIAVSEVRFDQIQPIAGLETGTLQSVRARLYNDSQRFTLTDYTYYLVIQDCLPAKQNLKPENRCTAVYDQRNSVSLSVPPNQARDVAIAIPRNPANSSLPFKLLGTPRIELSATDTRAYRTDNSTE